MLSIRLQPKCRTCGKFRPVEEFILNPTVGFCLGCHYENQAQYQRFLLTGEAPTFCHGCYATYDELAARDPSGQVAMAIHRKDGMIQFLCIPCSDQYERKRLDMFAGTPYAKLHLN